MSLLNPRYICGTCDGHLAGKAGACICPKPGYSVGSWVWIRSQGSEYDGKPATVVAEPVNGNYIVKLKSVDGLNYFNLILTEAKLLPRTSEE